MDVKYDVVQYRGFGMEKVVSQQVRTVYLSGHEHVFQHHNARGVQHVVCGNSGAELREGRYCDSCQSAQVHLLLSVFVFMIGEGFYRGPNADVDVDWYDASNTFGFVAFQVSHECVNIDFVDSTGQSFRHVTVGA